MTTANLTAGIRAVLAGTRTWAVEQADCLDWLRQLPQQSVDLVLGSPPYMDARTYNDGTLPVGAVTVRDCNEWVDWMLTVTEAAVRVSKGLVLWVVAGVQRDNIYWPGCEGLAWEWWKRGNHLWRPCVWWKVDADEGGTGIPGSGGKQWLRADWEYVLAFKRESRLPWADPLVMGHEPVYDRVGGAMSNRTADGQRSNKHVGDRVNGRHQNGEKKACKKMPPTPVHDGEKNIVRAEGRPFPKVVNPGNVLPLVVKEQLSFDGLVVKARVGGGHMGNRLCHKNEAPFPEELATFFVRSFCPEDGTVGDCFAGSGTSLAMAVRWGRRAVGCDLRQSQVELSRKRIAGEVTLFHQETTHAESE